MPSGRGQVSQVAQMGAGHDEHGASNKKIATRLHIAVHTVKSHVHNVLEKLALHSRLEVAAFTHSRLSLCPH